MRPNFFAPGRKVPRRCRFSHISHFTSGVAAQATVLENQDIRSMFQAIVESIFEPGVNSQLLTAINIAFVCLVVVVIFLLIALGFNIHLLVLLLLSSGLLLSINWFVSELWRASMHDGKEKKQE